jgi:excisionase family DNA binding protein
MVEFWFAQGQGNNKGTFQEMSTTQILHNPGGNMSHPGINTSKFLSVQEAAEFLRVSPRTVYGWVSQRLLPARYAGRRLLFLESELVEWTKPNLQPSQHRTFAR